MVDTISVVYAHGMISISTYYYMSLAYIILSHSYYPSLITASIAVSSLMCVLAFQRQNKDMHTCRGSTLYVEGICLICNFYANLSVVI